ncbi:unnamed protein product [Rotaria sp. Silwood2]|nr:unnamed protein product [Rotaria sp. Silwood2]
MAMQYNTDQKGLRIDHTTLTPRYSITNNESLNEGIAYLNKHGYAIFRDVLSQDEINTNKDLLSRFFETIPRCNIRRNDPSTWSSFWEVQKNKIHSMIILFLCLRPAFSHLNQRLQKLLNSSSLLLKVTLYGSIYNEPYISNCKLYLLLNRDDIDNLTSILINLVSLPRLSSLTIDTSNNSENLNDIYRLVFVLPTLKSFIFMSGSNRRISLPMVINQQMNTIEYLAIDHSWTYNYVFSIMSYTPQLRRLHVSL